ncbi:hypothetical protein FQN54_009945 [Arachnomyces sp. PD_36]|nr:hypothetical protein FQN54_009945 [Arachnomyces sp. PD_36]
MSTPHAQSLSGSDEEGPYDEIEVDDGGDEADDEAAGDDGEGGDIVEDEEASEREQSEAKKKRVRGMKRLPWPLGSRMKHNESGDTKGTPSSASMDQSPSVGPLAMDVGGKEPSSRQTPSILQDADDEMGGTKGSESQSAGLTGMDTTPLPRETPSIFQDDDDEAEEAKPPPTDPLPSFAGQKREHESEVPQGPSKKPRKKSAPPHKTAASARPKRGSHYSSRG